MRKIKAFIIDCRVAWHNGRIMRHIEILEKIADDQHWKTCPMCGLGHR